MEGAARQHRVDSLEPAKHRGMRRQSCPPIRPDIRMIATLLAGITAARRAGAFALLWLLVLTVLNVQTGGAWRSTILFAIPVAIASWTSWQRGFLFAAIAVIAAWYGGAMPEPGSTSPLWLDGMLSFLKLSIDAVVVNAWGRRRRSRTLQSGGN